MSGLIASPSLADVVSLLQDIKANQERIESSVNELKTKIESLEHSDDLNSDRFDMIDLELKNVKRVVVKIGRGLQLKEGLAFCQACGDVECLSTGCLKASEKFAHGGELYCVYCCESQCEETPCPVKESPECKTMCCSRCSKKECDGRVSRGHFEKVLALCFFLNPPLIFSLLTCDTPPPSLPSCPL